MRRSPEYRPEIHQDPTPAQAFRLASIGMSLAKKQGKTKTSSYEKNAHLFLPERQENLHLIDGDKMRYETHVFMGRVARVGYKQWSMRITEPFWMEGEDEPDWTRTIYKFEWTNNGVNTAERQIIVPGLEEESDSVLPETIDELFFEADLVGAINQLSVMTEADCTQLIRDMNEFSRSSFRVNKKNLL